MSLALMALVASPAALAQPARDGDRPGPFASESRSANERRAPMGEKPRGDRPDARPFTDAEFDRAAIMLENFLGPEAADRLREAAAENPEAASRTIRRDYPRLARFLEFRQRDPAADLRWDEVKLAGQVARLTRQHREAVAEDRPELARKTADELRETIALQFDVRAALREHELAHLEQRLEELRDELAEQSERRDEMIDQRLAQLTSGDGPVTPRATPFDPPPTRNASDVPATRPAE